MLNRSIVDHPPIVPGFGPNCQMCFFAAASGRRRIYNRHPEKRLRFFSAGLLSEQGNPSITVFYYDSNWSWRGATHGDDQRGFDWARVHGAVAFQRLGTGGEVLQAVPDARDAHRLRPAGRKSSAFAANWGWKNASTDWQQLVRSPEIGLVDVATPNYMHAPVAKAAIAAGKAVSCEKPIAGSLADAREMVKAAKDAKVKTFVWFNYRRCPAVAFAHQLIKAGKLGELRHVRAVYLQDWADESVPLVWRFDKTLAGSGAHGDLNAHIVDMTRFVTGQEITEMPAPSPRRLSRNARCRRASLRAASRRAAKAAAEKARSPSMIPCCSSPASPAAPWPASRPPGKPPATRTATDSRSTAPRARSSSISSG